MIQPRQFLWRHLNNDNIGQNRQIVYSLPQKWDSFQLTSWYAAASFEPQKSGGDTGDGGMEPATQAEQGQFQSCSGKFVRVHVFEIQ